MSYLWRPSASISQFSHVSCLDKFTTQTFFPSRALFFRYWLPFNFCTTLASFLLHSFAYSIIFRFFFAYLIFRATIFKFALRSSLSALSPSFLVILHLSSSGSSFLLISSLFSIATTRLPLSFWEIATIFLAKPVWEFEHAAAKIDHRPSFDAFGLF